ncbi:MAG: hypothetical protein PHR26_03050 [Candidatus ainarchaeum sp.]|nr:hypothetical protein [Candidatus ainarchaeum sp.]
MSEQSIHRAIVMDTSSINALLKYFKFKNSTHYTALCNFFADKIMCGEIIILDKVYTELVGTKKINRDTEFKRIIVPLLGIKGDICDTTNIPILFSTLNRTNEIEGYIEDYYIKENEEHFFKHIINEKELKEAIAIERAKYITEYADLYLIDTCFVLQKDKNNEVLLITEENKVGDGKLVKKIPTICLAEHIEYHHLPYLLYNLYESEIEFIFNRKSKEENT